MPWWLTLLIIAVLGTLAWGGVLAAPWLPLPHRDVVRLVALAGPLAGERMADLGCGDARILTYAARRYTIRGDGFEVALLPYVLAWCRIASAGLLGSVRVRYRDFFHQPLGQYQIITVFLTPRAMAKLGPKLAAELAAGTRVVSYAFPIPGWEPTVVSKPDSSRVAIYRYDIRG